MKEGVLMSEEIVSDQVQTQDAPAPLASLGAGQMLRAAREALGLHIAALAVSLKVPVKKLEALEAEQFDQLPDAVFVRALASSVARALKIDPGPILAKLPQTHAPRLHHSGIAMNTPFRGASDGPGPSVFASLSRPAVLAVLALLLGALVIIFFPKRDNGDATIMPPSGLLGAASGSLAAPGGEPVNAVPSAVRGALPDVSSKAPSGESAAVQSAVLSAQTSFAGNASTATAVIGMTAGSSMPMGITDSASLTSTLAITSVVKSTPTVASPTLVISTNSADAQPPPLPKDGIVVFSSVGESWK
jgi:cytoskeleton protein RodZ